MGAYDSGNTLVSFSSRGPVNVDGSGRLKPDVAAPGVFVRSAVPANAYVEKSGTSMAAPHVAGVVALLWSARPHLARDIAATKALLLGTANPGVVVSPPQTCGGISSTTIPNSSFGRGSVDAVAAVNAATTATPTPSSSPVPSATRTATPIASATATRTPTATPTATPTPPSCAPRPTVSVVATPDTAGRLRVDVSAGTGPGAPVNHLVRLDFGATSNALLDVTSVGAGLTGPVSVPLAPGTAATTFHVRRTSAGQPAHVTLTVVDACGDWPTFVGGGPTAF